MSTKSRNSKNENVEYDLEDRLLEFSIRIIKVSESLKRTRTGNHIADQLLRSGTSPYANHGEAESAESMNDFIHKLRLCHKELRESRRWLRLIQKASLIAKPDRLTGLVKENEELILIFAASIRTASTNKTLRNRPAVTIQTTEAMASTAIKN